MALSMKLWRVQEEGGLKDMPEGSPHSESKLEDWIADNPALLGLELLIIGRQVHTEFGGRIDLLGIDRQGDLSIIELKRDRTPLDRNLAAAFSDFFNEAIPENVNVNHRMLIVASEFDDSSERIVQYLAEEYQVNVNAIFFNFFADEQGALLGRAWLMDPEEVQDRAKSRKQAPWSGYWFVNVGEGSHRNWDDNVKYGYIGAGQGPKYSGPLKKLKEGDKVFAYMKGLGYVGYGLVVEPARMVRDFLVDGEGKCLLELPLSAPDASDNKDDPELSEWAVKVDWRKTFPPEQARHYKGIFANQNIVCKLRHGQTIDFLEDQFKVKEVVITPEL